MVSSSASASQLVVYKDDIDRLVANAKGGKGSKASAEQAEGQAVPQKEEPVKTTLEEESRTLGDEFAAVGADADDGDLPEEEFRD